MSADLTLLRVVIYFVWRIKTPLKNDGYDKDFDRKDELGYISGLEHFETIIDDFVCHSAEGVVDGEQQLSRPIHLRPWRRKKTKRVPQSIP